MNKKNTGWLLVNNKERLNMLDNCGVYQINFVNCDTIYIGQAGRSVKKHISKHVNSILCSKPTCGFSEHGISENHSPDKRNVKLLKSCNRGTALELFEIMVIKKVQTLNKFINYKINCDTQSGIFSIIYLLIMRSVYHHHLMHYAQ